MSEAVTFEEVVRAWMLYYDDRLPEDKTKRRQTFIILLGNLADHGFAKDDLTNYRQDKIVRACVNLNYANKSKLRKWQSIIAEDIKVAISIYYGTIKIRDDVVTAEMQAKLENMSRRAEETKKLRTADDGSDYNSEDEETPLISDNLNDLENSKKPKEDTFEITDEMLDQMEGPEVFWDPDFLKRLEGSDE